MERYRKILVWALKILAGLLCFWLIGSRLGQQASSGEWTTISHRLTETEPLLCVIFCFLLMPVNWGIEGYKWQRVTTQLEPMSYGRSLRGVLAGVCSGNLGPGRTLEFLAKVFFFPVEKRPAATVLHFMSGSTQLMATIVFGTIALLFKLGSLSGSDVAIKPIYLVLGAIAMLAFSIALVAKAAWWQRLLYKFGPLKKYSQEPIRLDNGLVFLLFNCSVLRFAIFVLQYSLLLQALVPGVEAFSLQVIGSICIYFHITTIVPMISFIEPAMRAAVALYVFRGFPPGSQAALIVSSTMLWVFNIVVPSVFGYMVILREKFQFKTLGG